MDRGLIRCWQSRYLDRRIAILHEHPELPECDGVPIFYGDTDGEAAGKVLRWMMDETSLSTVAIEVGVHEKFS